MNTRRSGRRVRGASSAGSSSDLDGTRSGDRVLHGSNSGTVAPGHLAEVKRDNPPATGGQGDDNPDGTLALLQRLLDAQEQRAVDRWNKAREEEKARREQRLREANAWQKAKEKEFEQLRRDMEAMSLSLRRELARQQDSIGRLQGEPKVELGLRDSSEGALGGPDTMDGAPATKDPIELGDVPSDSAGTASHAATPWNQTAFPSSSTPRASNQGPAEGERKGKARRSRKSKHRRKDSSPSSSSSDSDSYSTSTSEDTKRRRRRKKRRRKRKKRKGRRTKRDISTSESDEGSYFPRKGREALLDSIRKKPSLQDRSSPVEWLMCFLQEAQDHMWSTRQRKTLLPLAWDDKEDEGRTAWSQGIQGRLGSLTLLEVEQEFLKRFDEDGVDALMDTLLTEKQPVQMPCVTWWSSICKRWKYARRWDAGAEEAYTSYKTKKLPRNVCNKELDRALQKYKGSTLSDSAILALCHDADRQSRRDAEVEQKLFSVQHAGVYRVGTAAKPARQERQTCTTVTQDSIQHRGWIFGRGHARTQGEGCPWYLSGRGCNKGTDCPMPHVERSPELCPEGGHDYKLCPRGASCPKTHKENIYPIAFESRNAAGTYRLYLWRMRKNPQ